MSKVSLKHLSKVKTLAYYLPTYNPDLYYTHYHLLQLQDENREIDFMHAMMLFSVIFKVFQEPRGWIFCFCGWLFFVLGSSFFWVFLKKAFTKTCDIKISYNTKQTYNIYNIT